VTAALACRTTIRAALCLAVAACSAPPYDEQTDRLISTVQSDVDSEIVMLISLDRKIAELSGATGEAARKALAEARAKAGYEANAEVYDKLDSQLTSLRLRVDALPNEATPNIDHSIDELRASLLSDEGSLRSIHKKRGVLSEAFLLEERRLLNSQLKGLGFVSL
jgi:hypothetical protein